MKTKTLTVTFPWPDRDSNRTDLYRVEQITDSVEFAPHQLLKASDVDILCDHKDWRVTIKPFPR